jgi:hypothetical protein
MHVEIGTEAAQFLFWEFFYQIFGIVSLRTPTPPTVDLYIWGHGEDPIPK